MTNLFPAEIWALIFKHLSRSEDLEAFSKTCRLFKKIESNRAREVLYCCSYGGFCLSLRALQRLYQTDPAFFSVTNENVTHVLTEEEFLSAEDDDITFVYVRDGRGCVRCVQTGGFQRTDLQILAIVKELGLKASSGHYCELDIKKIKAGYDYKIAEYDGNETVYPVLPYKTIIEDLCRFYKTGSRDWQSILTQKIIDKDPKVIRFLKYTL